MRSGITEADLIGAEEEEKGEVVREKNDDVTDLTSKFTPPEEDLGALSVPGSTLPVGLKLVFWLRKAELVGITE